MSASGGSEQPPPAAAAAITQAVNVRFNGTLLALKDTLKNAVKNVRKGKGNWGRVVVRQVAGQPEERPIFRLSCQDCDTSIHLAKPASFLKDHSRCA